MCGAFVIKLYSVDFIWPALKLRSCISACTIWLIFTDSNEGVF